MTKILIEDIEKEVNGTMFYEFNEFMEEFGADVFADLTLKSLVHNKICAAKLFFQILSNFIIIHFIPPRLVFF